MSKSKWKLWNRNKRQETEVLPWSRRDREENESRYEAYPDTTRSSLFAAGEEDWDVSAKSPVFAPRADGSSRSYSYEDFLRARGQSGRGYERGSDRLDRYDRYADGPFGNRRYYDEEEDEGSLTRRRVVQVIGAVALVVLLYATFHSEQPMAQTVQSVVRHEMTQDSNLQALTSWWHSNVSDKVAVPTFSNVSTPTQGQDPQAATQKFAMPVQGTVKTAYDGNQQQGITFAADSGAEVKAASGGMVEKVDKEDKDDFTITINHGKSGKTIYRHLVAVTVNANDWVEANQTLGTLAKSDHAELFFAWQKDGSFVNPASMLGLPDGR